MLATLGLITILVLLVAIMTGKMSPLGALIVIPIAASLVGGFGLETGTFVMSGIRNLAPVVAMFVFAILFFGVLTDTGLFDPVVDRILRAVGSRPRWIVPGTALMAMVVHLDGSGAVTFLLVVPAMLPLYEELNMDRRLLACAAALAAGVMNILPWGGPTLRAAAALNVSVTDLFTPLAPVLAVGVAFVLGATFLLGRREERRLDRDGGRVYNRTFTRTLTDEERALRRPGRFWINVVLTVFVLSAMITGWAPPAVAFMLGTALALVVNYPKPSMQRERVDAHARAALMMASILLAAGVFTGIMQESGMLDAMANAAVSFVPADLAGHIPVALGLTAMPLSLLFDPDSFYFGVLPVVAGVSDALGVAPLHVGQGALMGQMTTGFPVSPLTPATFLLTGLAGIDLGEHQKFSIPFLWAASIIMTAAAVIFGVIPV